MSRLLLLCVFLASFSYTSSTEVCTNTLLPGAKGDQGETGEQGDQGKIGKNGPPGLSGTPGEPGIKGEIGQTGKIGITGEKGDKGNTGMEGPHGLKGGPGTTCDCGRYRRVVGQLDLSVGKLRNAINFVKTVVLGLRETEEMYYFIVKEAKTFREASVNCKVRGGSLAMPKTSTSNHLMADYVNQAGLTGVYVGVIQDPHRNTNETSSYMYADSSPLLGFSAWGQEEKLSSRQSLNISSSCVELLSTGTWGHVECDSTMYFLCEFLKDRRRGAGGRGLPAAALLPK
ncbi:hypothetical protein OJAV_G00156660 [Oryzias javanicus]|uniref:C-type lectin domain-containing protein n=1 Tax=Oryzias javanicus TaxID=123683 RepID=A0A3S2U451_ORYJA|nr:hypothetical protein OJAV_G00156660 [Oryzias javanicus]